MVFSIITRGLLRTSKEILDRNLTVGAVTILNGFVDVDIRRSSYTPERSLSSHVSSTLQARINKILLPKTTINSSALLYNTRKYTSKRYHAQAKAQNDSDVESDDEYETKRQSTNFQRSERGDSEFWRRKMRTLHRILDVNRDGVISFDDFSLLAQRFIDLGHLSPEHSAEFLEVLTETWTEQFGEITPYNSITAEQFLVDFHHRLNDKDMAKRIGRFLPYLFKAVDHDHTGHLDLDQYKLFFRCLGLTDEDAAISFAVIDKNGDGQLSMKEFNHLGRQYFLTEDETKISKMFWGPLIDH